MSPCSSTLHSVMEVPHVAHTLLAYSGLRCGCRVMITEHRIHCIASEVDACHVGCDGRESLSPGPFSFIDCQRKCDSKFAQESDSKARSACSYACMLPMTSSVYMSVKYSGNGKPDVKIVRSSNGFTSVERPLLPMNDVDGLIANIFGDVNRHILPFRTALGFDEPASESKERNSVHQSDSDSSIIDAAHSRMLAMHNHMNQMLTAFTRQFFDGIRNQMQSHHHLANERPANHDAFAHMGPEVGNILSDGKPIIQTHSVNTESNAEGRPIQVVRYQMSSNHPPSVFYWIMIVFGVGALLLTIYASVIFFRVMRSAAYRRISAETVPARCSAASLAPGPVPVKKVPLDGWVERSEPSGVPPPAYDQVSIHSIQKQQKPDIAPQTSTTTDDSSQPTSDQK